MTMYERGLFAGAMKALRPGVQVYIDHRGASVIAETDQGIQRANVSAMEIEAFGAVRTAERLLERLA